MITIEVYRTALIFASLFSIGLCIKCYQCNSAVERECADLAVNDTNSEYYKECNGNYDNHIPFCRKIFTKVLDVEDSTRIIRSCGWLNNQTNADYCRKSDTDFFIKKSCQCFSDGCNSSERVTSTIKLPFVTVVFSFFILFFCKL